MTVAAQGQRDWFKWGFFGLMTVFVLLVIWVDEKFLVIRTDPEWKHIAAYKWLLLPHGLFGALALFSGPWQFSDRIRAARPDIHRWTGRIYLSAVCVSAPFAMYIGTTTQPRTIYIEQYFQAGLWWLVTAFALIAILRRQLPQHKLWMMRSYGFCLIFVLSRVPDAFVKLSDQQLSDMLWSLVICALAGPDIALMLREWARRAARPRARAPVGPKVAPAE